jgi:glycosyltransferase involved in cell wall biosynthesis
MSLPLVTVITATTGNPLLENCLNSVKNQTYKNIQHLVTIDGPDRSTAAYKCISDSELLSTEGYRLDVIDLPYSIGKDRWNGHRIYGSGTYVADGDFLIFLDDDNALEPNHIETCLSVIAKGHQWAYTFRKIVDQAHNFLCEDNCESLGKWASVLHSQDYFIDVNCYFLPRLLAVAMCPVWFRKFREPGQMEIDRAMIAVLKQMAPNFECTYDYTVKYATGNSSLSVQSDFFASGNAEMLKRYNGVLPWKKR